VLALGKERVMEKIKMGTNVIEIPLDDLYINIAQVRTENVGKDIAELAESISKVGQLEPIVVAPAKEKGKYEIIAGQRRYLAHKELGAASIRAVVIEEPLEEHEAKVLSLTENWHRLGLSHKDELNACLLLWRRYKSVPKIVEETGLSPVKVRKYLRYETLPEPLKKKVDEGEIDLTVAERAAAAASVRGKCDESEAVSLAEEMKQMSDAQRKNIVKKREENPDVPVDEVVEAAKTHEKVTQIVVTLGPGIHEGLRRYAAEESCTQDIAAAGIIEEGLATKGYIEGE
jgi:ParB family chromosome partitioning protein